MINGNKFHIFLLIWLVLFWFIMAIAPVDRHDWLAENILFFIFTATLIITYKKFKFSTLSYSLITIFLTLHLIGAHYTYSNVPLGFWLQDALNLNRNHFDRLVHFSFGLLMTQPVIELLFRKTKIIASLRYLLTIAVILALSALFEIIEWLFVLQANPELGILYLGAQGDMWDAQKDMILAVIGSVIAMIGYNTEIFMTKIHKDSSPSHHIKHQNAHLLS